MSTNRQGEIISIIFFVCVPPESLCECSRGKRAQNAEILNTTPQRSGSVLTTKPVSMESSHHTPGLRSMSRLRIPTCSTYICPVYNALDHIVYIVEMTAMTRHSARGHLRCGMHIRATTTTLRRFAKRRVRDLCVSVDAHNT